IGRASAAAGSGLDGGCDDRAGARRRRSGGLRLPAVARRRHCEERRRRSNPGGVTARLLRRCAPRNDGRYFVTVTAPPSLSPWSSETTTVSLPLRPFSTRTRSPTALAVWIATR